MSSKDKKEKILVIESDSNIGEKIVSAINNEGYNGILVKDGKTGLENILENLPNLVILDVTLEGADAYEILENKVAESMLVKIPVFLMSTQGMPINMRRIPQGSVTEFLMALQANPKDIVDKVNDHFGYHSEVNNPAPAVKDNKILWVEDDKLINTILSKKLEASGFELAHARDGEEALKTLAGFQPNIIVVDLLLPGMSGFDLIQQIRKDVRLKNIPVVILSNLSKHSDVERAKLLGVQKFIVKAATSLDQIVKDIQGLLK